MFISSCSTATMAEPFDNPEANIAPGPAIINPTAHPTTYAQWYANANNDPYHENLLCSGLMNF